MRSLNIPTRGRHFSSSKTWKQLGGEGALQPADLSNDIAGLYLEDLHAGLEHYLGNISRFGILSTTFLAAVIEHLREVWASR